MYITYPFSCCIVFIKYIHFPSDKNLPYSQFLLRQMTDLFSYSLSVNNSKTSERHEIPVLPS